ncbi:alpha/beta fold hydrolase [Streptomyces sp. RKAG290]|uniref:alpha/beta hydrolase n=1 Tax=Streptomyces sp. RKAG290 TaxID=2888348 RepID=UPI00203361C0|nr:alpha/beta fold hydrolase [Streptomyces sp. RKAG290]MCM2413057.1 lysophospholipase [Streptomyces sp. RKAG290]
MTERRPPKAAVLLLHGGRETGLGAPLPGPFNLPAVRMRPFARALGRALPGDVLVRAVTYGHRGWNGSRADPLHDVLRALDELRSAAGEIPVVLVGHSMGGRAALHAAGHPLVRGVVGLAPWCPEGDPVSQLDGRDVVLVHGTRDRITSPAGSRTLTARARRAGARTCLVTVHDSDHAMLRRAPAWHRLTVSLVTGVLGRAPLPGPVAEALRLPPGAPAEDGAVDLDRLNAGSAAPCGGVE